VVATGDEQRHAALEQEPDEGRQLSVEDSGPDEASER
jgi:hypothetical protein